MIRNQFLLLPTQSCALCLVCGTNEGLVLHFYVLCCWKRKTESISRSSVSSAQHSDSQGLLIRLISADDRKQELLQTPGVGGEQSGQRFVQYDIQ